jgi:hypothetical protein
MSKHLLTPHGLWTLRSERHVRNVYVAIKFNTYCIIVYTERYKVCIVYLWFVEHNLLVVVLVAFPNMLLIFFFVIFQ